MKIALLLLFVTISFTICSEDEENLRFLADKNFKGLDGKTIRVYSMVWSAKYYNPGEKKTFFFAIPFSFQTTINVNTKLNTIHLDYNKAENFNEMFKIVKTEAKSAEESSWNRLISFTDGYTKSDLNLDFTSNPDFALTNVKVYQNQFAKSVQIKLTQPQSKNPRALYVTFDFAKGEVDASDIEAFISYVNSLEKK